jgi:hypothetical protein
LFTLEFPLSKGEILGDEVGLGKTADAAIKLFFRFFNESGYNLRFNFGLCLHAWIQQPSA